MSRNRLARTLLILAVLSFLTAFASPSVARAQEHSSEPAQASPADHSIDSELAKETREAAGEEEHEDLKHSAMVGWVAKKTGLRVHQAHLAAVILNFAIIAFLIYWLARKSVPAAMRNRTASIQKALEEARAASADSDRRLKEIEDRLRQLDSEIAQMQSVAQTDAAAEEVRIKAAAEEDIRKVVESAEQEIAATAKQARRDLMAHTADLAVALARKQIQVDPATDQTLVRTFAVKLSSGDGGKERA